MEELSTKLNQGEAKEKLLLKIPYKDCVNCGTPLVKTHTRRSLQDLKGHYYLDIELGRCINERCSCKGIRVYPKAYRRLIYPKSDYSLAVYAQIGYQRLNLKRSVSEILQEVKGQYPHLKMGERSVENIFKRVQMCLCERESDKGRLKKLLKSSGISQLCLTVDGIAPEQGNSVLYVVREAQSGIILFGRYLEHSDAEHLEKGLFRPLKGLTDKLGIEVGGWLCDKQNGFIPAIEQVFEGVPIHMCQAHFLKAMGKPVQQADSQMGKAIKKNSGA